MKDFLGILLSIDVWLPLVGSLVTGMLIGLDREMQGKPAGLRTHTLVCFAAAILTLVSARQGEWTMELWPGQQIVTDPSRMAHGILTGIGFLGAGVIFREGPSVQGLTTAASLWIAAALGIVFGVGLSEIALAGAGATILVLVGLRMIYAVLPRHEGIRLSIAVRPEAGLDVEGVRRLLHEHGLPNQPLSQSFDAESGITEFATSTWSRSMAACDRLADALRAHPAVVRFDMLLVEDAGARDAAA